jgi:hypothetical protein
MELLEIFKIIQEVRQFGKLKNVHASFINSEDVNTVRNMCPNVRNSEQLLKNKASEVDANF